MAMHFGPQEHEDEVVSQINTTPLVDVMLVLLIIFLITIPVATHTVRLDLPRAKSVRTQVQQGNIVLAVTRDGRLYWNETPLPDEAELARRLQQAAQLKPQPQIQVRGDSHVKFDAVGQILSACQQAGISRVDFITQDPR